MIPAVLDKRDAADALGRGRIPRGGRLFRKYLALFVGIVGIALLANTLVEVLFSYQDHKDGLIRVQREQAQTAAVKIGQFIETIESQLGWTLHMPWSSVSEERRQFDGLRLLRQVPAITEFRQLDPMGREQIRVSRLGLDTLGAGTDLSQDPRFLEAMDHGAYYGPVYFKRESEPFMALSLAGPRRDLGVSAVEVNLTFIWELVTQIKVGEHGLAYVVDEAGRLIAHPNKLRVLRKTDLSQLAQVKAARNDAQADTVRVADDIDGRRVLTTFVRLAHPGWIVFVELPLEEAYAPFYVSIVRTGLLLAASLVLTVLAGLLLARRMVAPIEALGNGAARIGGGDLGQRIHVRSGDELEALADQFNDMAARLQQSYADLEHKIADRTRELAQSVEELRTLGEVSQAIGASLDLETVLSTIVTKATQLSGMEVGAIYVFSRHHQVFRVRATSGLDELRSSALRAQPVPAGDRLLGLAAGQSRPTPIADLNLHPRSSARSVLLEAGFRALLVVPLLHADQLIGALIVGRQTTGPTPQHMLDLLRTFGAQSVVAIQNARLYRDLSDKGAELETTSQHKSQFLANMSHELRTPLNAVLGYTDLILNDIYGEISPKVRDVLERVQNSGQHLLGLINDVLDLSKIEAGRLTLSVVDYSLSDIVHAVHMATEPLAAAKQLSLSLDVPDDLPPARGDERRLTQVLLNLVGNAIKFTETGGVTISCHAVNDQLMVDVTDTGPGIAPADQARIFEEFHQAGTAVKRKAGGTGLGLAIARRIIELHGGRIWVRSEPGRGATFSFSVPVQIDPQADQT